MIQAKKKKKKKKKNNIFFNSVFFPFLSFFSSVRYTCERIYLPREHLVHNLISFTFVTRIFRIFFFYRIFFILGIT